ncbi:MAG: Ig-like domain-containing protein, partial [Solirubrobacterales bacterium]
PSADIVTTATTHSIGGFAEPGSTVTVYDGATEIGTAVADADTGEWSLSADPSFDEGVHNLTATSTDEAGNVSDASDVRKITVDNTDPSVSISAPDDGAHIGVDHVDVTFAVSDANLSQVLCSVNGSAFTACGSSPLNLTDLEDGQYVVSVLAADEAGNQSSATVTFYVDTQAPSAPSVTLTSPTSSPTQQTTATIAYGGIEAAATAECKLDDGDWDDCDASPVDLSSLSEGSHTYSVRQTDQAGNTSNAGSVTWVVDHTAPSAPSVWLNDPESSPTNSTHAEVGYVDIESGATAECKLDDGDWATCGSSPISLNGLGDGTHTYSVRQTDAAGNVSDAGSVSWVVDTAAPSAPSVSLTSPTTSPTQQTSATIAYDGIESGATAECKLDDGDWVECDTSPVELSDLDDGTHTYSVRQVDEAGNISGAGSVSWTVDTTAPTGTTITAPTDGTHTSQTKPVFSGEAEAGSSVTVYEGTTEICTAITGDDGKWTCTATDALSQGEHTFTAVATDEAGNESDASDEVTITVDTTNPSVTISSPGAASTVTTHTPSVSFTVDDGSATVTCKVDSAAPVSCSSPFTTASLADGSHTVTVTATDAAGNVGTASVTFTIDTTAPDTTIDTHPDALSTSTSATFTFHADDNGATFECKLDGGDWTACESGDTFSGLGQGQHTLQVRGTDSHGNVETSPASFTWTVDSIAPAVPTVSAPIGGSVVTTSKPPITGKADAGSKVTVTIDGHDFGPVTADGNGDWTYTPTTALGEGDHTVTAKAKDDAGNTSAASAPVTFTIDTTPPNGNVAQQTGTGTLPGEAPTFDISSDDGTATTSCAIDGGASSPCSSPFKPTGTFSPGTHTLVVTFTDTHGNVSTKTIVFIVAGAADPLPEACFKTGIAISNLTPSGSKVTLSGFARISYAGQTVKVTYKPTGKVVGTALVAKDGSFTAKFKAPKKSLWLSNKSLYQAAVGTEKTTWTKLSRRVASSTATYSGGKLTVKGLLSKPLYPKAKATITARTGCGDPFSTFAAVKIKSNGTFSVTAPYTPSSGVIFVKVAAVVSKGGKTPKPLRTYSFVMPVIVK